MQKVTVEAKTREGKITARKLKKEGSIPAVVYGKETKSMPIEIKIKDIEKTVKTLNEGMILITLKLTDKNEEKTVVIQEVQRDPVSEEIVHADFHQINENEKHLFKVPVTSKGVPAGVKIGGTLEFITREIPVRCLIKDLPERFEFDISGMEIGHDFTVADIKAPQGVEIMEEKQKVLFTVLAIKAEEEKKPAEGEAAAAPAEPEVLTAKKPKEGEAAAPAKEKGKK